jgi:ADP-ribosylglycohydrolase
MAKNIFLKEIIKADSQCLPAHWIYNPGKIIRKYVDYPYTGDFKNKYHPGKTINDNTHYGDQFIDTIEFYIEQKGNMSYDEFYLNRMKQYTGYIDSANKETLEKSVFGEIIGSNSNEIGGVCRVLPSLVLDPEIDIHGFVDFSALTHNCDEAKQTAAIIYQMIVNKQYDFEHIKTIIAKCTASYYDIIYPKIVLAEELMQSRDFNEIALKIGTSCHFFDALPLIVFILNRYQDHDDQLAANFYLGGDNAARAMIIAAIQNFPNK